MTRRHAVKKSNQAKSHQIAINDDHRLPDWEGTQTALPRPWKLKGVVAHEGYTTQPHYKSQWRMYAVVKKGTRLFFIPFIIFALLFSLPPSRNSDPGSHGRLFSTTVRVLHFYREKISALSSSSTRVELCVPTLGAVSSWSFFYFCK